MDDSNNNSSSNFQKDFLKSVQTSASLEAQKPEHSPKNVKKLPKWFFVILSLAILAIVGGIIAVALINNSNDDRTTETSLSCTDGGDVTIKIIYNDNELLSYSASNVPFDFEKQKTLADLHGVEYVIMDFAYWFENHVQDGRCDL